MRTMQEAQCICGPMCVQVIEESEQLWRTSKKFEALLPRVDFATGDFFTPGVLSWHTPCRSSLVLSHTPFRAYHALCDALLSHLIFLTSLRLRSLRLHHGDEVEGSNVILRWWHAPGNHPSLHAGSLPQARSKDDVFILRQICHDWADEPTIKILKSVRAAMGNTKCMLALVEVRHCTALHSCLSSPELHQGSPAVV